jgi:hypothetical protein
MWEGPRVNIHKILEEETNVAVAPELGVLPKQSALSERYHDGG